MAGQIATMGLTDVHHLFLQACANHGTLSVSQAVKILNHIFYKYNDKSDAAESDLQEVIEDINNQISKFDQEIKRVTHDLIGKDFIVFANTAEVEINKFQTHYTQADCNYFRIILKEIVTSEGLCIRPIVALNLSNQLKAKAFTKNHAEELIQEWCDLGYFLEKDDLIYFGPKVLAEFGSHLKTHYPDFVNMCSLCMQLIFWPISCEKCSTPFHRECIRKYLIKMSKCPSCKKIWDSRVD